MVSHEEEEASWLKGRGQLFRSYPQNMVDPMTDHPYAGRIYALLHHVVFRCLRNGDESVAARPGEPCQVREPAHYCRVVHLRVGQERSVMHGDEGRCPAPRKGAVGIGVVQEIRPSSPTWT